jgi:adenylate cyclase
MEPRTKSTVPSHLETKKTTASCPYPTDDPVEEKIHRVKLTVLFTDIKGSSSLWSKYPDEMLRAMDWHTVQVDRLVCAHGGTIIKLLGDAFMITFDTVDAAINFAVALQTAPKKIALRPDKPLELRIGIAEGEAIERQTIVQKGQVVLDYLGPVVNLASRMESKVSAVNGFAVAVQSERSLQRLIRRIPIDRFRVCIKQYAVRAECVALTSAFADAQCLDVDQLKGIETRVLVLKALPAAAKDIC